MLIDINPTYAHSVIKTIYSPKRKYYHWDRMKLANSNGYKYLSVWEWDNFENLVKAIKNNTLIIRQNQDIQKHWSKSKTSKHIIDNNFDEQQMIAEGWLPIYDDGQELVY